MKYSEEADENESTVDANLLVSLKIETVSFPSVSLEKDSVVNDIDCSE